MSSEEKEKSTTTKAVITIQRECAPPKRGKRSAELAPKRRTVMSLPEKEILSSIQPPEPPLPYPTKPMKMAFGPDAIEYIIPDDADRQSLLNQLYPFENPPNIDEERFDIHEQASFHVREFRIIREMDRNFLVSPWFNISGGMCIDWVTKETAVQGELLIKKPDSKPDNEITE